MRVCVHACVRVNSSVHVHACKWSLISERYRPTVVFLVRLSIYNTNEVDVLCVLYSQQHVQKSAYGIETGNQLCHVIFSMIKQYEFIVQ